MRRWWLLTFGIAVLATALSVATACGGEDEDEGDDGEPVAMETDSPEGETPGRGEVSGVDPCELLSADEVEDVLGGPVGEPTLDDSAYPLVSCSFATEDAAYSVDVMLYSGEREEVEALFEYNREEFEEVEGVGEAAYWAAEPFSQIEVLQGNYEVAISVYAPGEESHLEAAKDLAKKALDRLPD